MPGNRVMGDSNHQSAANETPVHAGPLAERCTAMTRRLAIAPAAIRDQLSRIIASGIFADSARMTRFLQFAVEETLRGNARELKESIIGTQVFDRPLGYDSRLDPIVRVEARRLRSKLSAYYEGAGRQDQIVFELPKGQYAPVFRARPAEAAPPAAAIAQSATRIAVLPFVTLETGAEPDFLADGLTEDLINALTRLPGLHIVAWNSAAQLRDQQDELDTVRERLQVDYVVRGSIRRTKGRELEERLRISAYLIDTETHRYVWSEVYNRTLEDMFQVQDEIAASIVSALELTLARGQLTHIAGGKPRNMEAYQVCLKGRFHARERTIEGLQRSIICFEQAIALDPDSASAYAGLADTYTLLAEYGLADGPTCMEKAKELVQQALVLDASSAEAWASSGLILSMYDWAWREAQEAYLRSLAINPGYAMAHHWFGADYLAHLGQFAAADHHMDLALRLDPLSPLMHGSRALMRVLAGRFEEAIQICTRILTSDPSFYQAYTCMGRAYLQLGDYAKAIEMLERGLALSGPVPNIFGAMGQAYALAGNRAQANAMLERLRQMAVVGGVPGTCFAVAHIGLDEREQALDWLERAVERRELRVIALYCHPAYDALRGEPRFERLLDRIGFRNAPPYLP